MKRVVAHPLPGSCNMFLVLFVLNTLHLQLAASCSSQATNPRHNPVVQTVPSPLVKQSVRRYRICIFVKETLSEALITEQNENISR